MNTFDGFVTTLTSATLKQKPKPSSKPCASGLPSWKASLPTPTLATPMLELICAAVVAVVALCAYAVVRSALRRRRAPATTPSAIDPHERVLSLVRSGRRLAAMREAKELAGGDVADAVAFVERLESGSGR